MAKSKRSEAASESAESSKAAQAQGGDASQSGSGAKVARPARSGSTAKAAAPKEAKATPTRKPTARKGKKEQKPAAAPAGGGVPLVDTSLAAESAARMLMGKVKLGAAVQPAKSEPEGNAKESPSFRQFKESLLKPAAHTPGKALGNTFAPKNPLPIPGTSPVFHNQTLGGTSRINIPRRTGG